jgi:CHASE2 domain-containing sensor protein
MTDEPRRDPAGIVLACVLLAIGLVLAGMAAAQRGWWWLGMIPAAFALCVGGVGLAQDVQRRPRDAKGRPVDQRGSQR